MTNIDEKMFCEELQKISPNIKFIDTTPILTDEIKIYNDVTESTSKNFTIINFDIISIDEYKNYMKNIKGYYHFPVVGKGIIQFLRSYPSNYYQNAIQPGRISASFHSDNNIESEFVNKIFYILNKIGNKIYRTTANREIPIISDKPERMVVAFPNAIEEYCGTNGKYLEWTKEIFFVGKLK
jgi:hypothetical protein